MAITVCLFLQEQALNGHLFAASNLQTARAVTVDETSPAVMSSCYGQLTSNRFRVMRVLDDAAAHVQSDSCVTRYQRLRAEIERGDLTAIFSAFFRSNTDTVW
jgi:hypothetical protein